MIVQDTEFDSVGDRLKKHWALHNVEINAGASEADLRSFEAIYGVVLPNDLRDYFLCVNGMPQDVVDEAMIRFWMLEELKPLTEGALQYSDPAYIHRPESLFLFADSAFGHMLMLSASKAARSGRTKSSLLVTKLLSYWYLLFLSLLTDT